ncbi:MAG TPA: GGDEF domain-containing protein [Actinoplanes sp.]|nr:GGDEF domain-containing protein [Actinoplanes sp.]
MTATLDPHVRRRRRVIEVSVLVCRSGGIVASALAIVGPLRIGTARPAAMVASSAVCLTVMAVACVLTLINIRRPDGPRYSRYGIIQVAADTFATCVNVYWAQFHDGRVSWPLLLIPIVTAAQRLQLRGTLTVWAITAGTLIGGAMTTDQPLVKPEDVIGGVIITLLVTILCGSQSNAAAQHVHDLQEARRQLEHQAGHDALTGLPNRSQLERHAAGLDGRALGVLLLDLDGFKQVNDTFGHAAGDDLLKAIAERITRVTRGGDLPGRLGGDEFVLLLADADQSTVDVVANRLRTSICEPVDVAGRTVRVGVSIGVVCRAAGDPGDFALLAAMADSAMYQEKQLLNR